MRVPPWLRLAPVVLLLVACDSPSEPRDDEDPLIPLEPNPANATVTTQSANAVTATVPLTGGTLVATGADGTVFTLTIPGDALIAETTITMTPIATLTGAGISGGRPAGVQLEPEGLQLLAPATLLIAPPEGPDVEVIGMAYHGTGQEIHRAPVMPDPTKLEMPVMHFSGRLVYLGDGNWAVIPLQHVNPTDWADRIENALEFYLRGERARLLRGEAPDPNLPQILENVAHEYWERVVEPMLNRMMTDCAYAEANMKYALGWSRQVSLIDLENQFETEQARVTSTYIAALENCWGETVGDCLDNGDTTQVRKAFGYARQLALLGVNDPRYDPTNPSYYCASWAGTASASGAPSGSGPTEAFTTTVSWELVPDHSSPEFGVYTYQVLEGTVTWTLSGTSVAGCSYEGSETITLAPEDGTLTLMLGGPTPSYSAVGSKQVVATVTETCPEQEPEEIDWSVGAWLFVESQPTTPEATQLSGTATSGPWTYTWSFTK